MTWRSHVTGARDWSIAFLLLSSRRVQPLWDAAGVPESVTREPATAVGAARELLLAFGNVTTEDAARDAVVRAFERLEADYGPAAADAVDVWARRHFVRPSPWDTIDAWKWILNIAAAAPDKWLSSLAGSDLRRRVRDTLADSFTEPYGRVLALERAAEAREPTAVEGSFHKLEVSAEDAISEFPVVALATQTAARELTVKTWIALDAALSPQEVATVVEWARALAPTVRMPSSVELQHPLR